MSKEETEAGRFHPDRVSDRYRSLDAAGARLGRALGTLVVEARRLATSPRPGISATQSVPSTENGSTPLTRAEQLVAVAGAKLGDLASRGRFQLRRGVARAREEAEDIWAEADELRRERRAPTSDGRSSASVERTVEPNVHREPPP
jgi:hypothetical protein